MDIEPIEAFGVRGQRQEARGRARLEDRMDGLFDAEPLAQRRRPAQHLRRGRPHDLRLIARDGRGIGDSYAFIRVIESVRHGSVDKIRKSFLRNQSDATQDALGTAKDAVSAAPDAPSDGTKGPATTQPTRN